MPIIVGKIDALIVKLPNADPKEFSKNSPFKCSKCGLSYPKRNKKQICKNCEV